MHKVPQIGQQPFDRSKHIYQNDAFVELVKDVIRFFNGTPVHTVPPPERFRGTGVYSLYYTGTLEPYGRYAELNRLAYDFPIYVGKAVPKGWRQSRTENAADRQGPELYSRIREHGNSIRKVEGFRVEDFACRFIISEGASSDMMGSIEAALIKWKKPLWNSHLDGFGNHDPGKGRYEQAKSGWDVVHPGRSWAEKCKGKTPSRDTLLKKIEQFLATVGGRSSTSMDPSGGDAFGTKSKSKRAKRSSKRTK